MLRHLTGLPPKRKKDFSGSTFRVLMHGRNEYDGSFMTLRFDFRGFDTCEGPFRITWLHGKINFHWDLGDRTGTESRFIPNIRHRRGIAVFDPRDCATLNPMPRQLGQTLKESFENMCEGAKYRRYFTLSIIPPVLRP